MRAFLSLLFLMTFLPSINAETDEGQVSIEIILDASNSMNDSLEGVKKIETAKQVITNLLQTMDPSIKLAFRVYGSNFNPLGTKQEACQDSLLSVGFDDVNARVNIAKTLSTLNAKGYTPISYSLTKSSEDFIHASANANKAIILVSDGKETCGGNPCSTVKSLQQQGFDMVVHSIGFAVDDETRSQLTCIAEATGGQYFEAKDASQLQESFKQVEIEVKSRVKEIPQDTNLLSPENGGMIITGSQNMFAKLIDEKIDKLTWFAPKQEGVFAFKDQQIAMIDSVALPIFKTTGENLKSFDIWVSTESPTDGFTKIGTYELQNIRMFQDVFQKVSFDQPIPAKYVKLVLKSAANGKQYIQLYEFKIFGDLKE